MKMADIDDFYLQVTRSLNPFAKCECKFLEGKILDSPILVPQQQVYFDLGHEVHEIEEKFWHGMMKHGKKMMLLVAEGTAEEIHDMLFQYKQLLVGSHYPNVFEYTSNLLWIDAQRFVDLREHFDGNIMQAYEYWMPLEVEYEYTNHDTKVNLTIDRLHKIPARYKNYKNVKDALGIFDMKPGKVGKFISANNEYDKWYGGDFNRQLAFYCDNLEYEINGVNVVDRYAVGLYYRNRQLLADRFDGRTYGALDKLVTRFWDTETFSRRVHNDWKYDACNTCERRGTCRNTRQLWKEEGDSRPLSQFVTKKECTKCNKKFYTFKRHVDVKVCNECRVKEMKKNA